jgi:hypothetical protein
MSDSEDISESTFDALVEQAVQARAGNAGGPRRACIDAGAAAQQGAGGNPPPSVSVHQPPPACPQASESLTASAAAAPCPSEPTAGRVEQQGQQPPATAQHPEKRAAPALSPNAAPPATRRVPASFSLPPGQHAGHHRQPLAVLPQQPQPQPPGHTAGAAAAADQHPQPAKAASSTAGGSGASSHSSSTSTSLQPITYQGKTLYANTVADVDRLAGDVLKLSPQVGWAAVRIAHRCTRARPAGWGAHCPPLHSSAATRLCALPDLCPCTRAGHCSRRTQHPPPRSPVCPPPPPPPRR